jgi:peptidoglycan/LPS O-acetylase OafA/YrhL
VICEVDLQPEGTSHSDIPLIRAYMPELDSARGLAILAVVFYHGIAGPLQNDSSTLGRTLFTLTQYGWAGVNLFFVLSGFLITGILLDSRHKPDYFRRFYFRRALRILPAFYATLLALFAGGWISFRFILISVLFLANFAAGLSIGPGYGTFWSLAVEEHFYLLWPVLVRRCSNRTLIIVAASMAVASPFLRIFTVAGHPIPQHFASLYTWFNVDGLSLGALLAIWLRMPSFRRHQLSRFALPATIAGCVGLYLVAGHPWADAVLAKTACNLAAVGFLSCMLLVGASKWSFVVHRPALNFYGFISYGLYLIHILAFQLAQNLLARPINFLLANGNSTMATILRFTGGLLLGTAFAYLSRRSLEERFLRIRYVPKLAPAITPTAPVPAEASIGANS